MSTRKPPPVSQEPVVFLHGFDETTLLDAVRAVRDVAAAAGLDPKNIAFTTSTPTNLEWKVRALIREVRKEHEYFEKNIPG
jgi:hypothetical protein